MKVAVLFSVVILPASVWAQTNFAGSASVVAPNPLPEQIGGAASYGTKGSQSTEEIRSSCINGRRLICGKILKVLPGGLIVDSGYTDLVRPLLNHSWLLPGSITANRPDNLIEGKEPECVAVGRVFLTNLPKVPEPNPKQYDYVVILGYPAGEYTYISVGNVKRTVRRFTTTLARAVELDVQAEESKNLVAAGK